MSRPQPADSGKAVCVFCASSSRIDRKFVDLAAEVGAELARRGHSLVSGGGQVSCMGAVARAARAGGARTVGVIPEGLAGLELADHDSDELIVTPDMRSRKGEMDRRSDAFLVLPGGIGTLEELFEIWTSRVLGMHDKPLVLLDPYGVYEPLRDLMRGLADQGFARPKIFDAIGWTGSVTEAFDLLERSWPRIQATPEDYAEAEP
ncbi:cytokinin riboside 5'-monophosphate phosphoribohydrolase [Actinomadura sp. NBRC 104425]|uniref:LOG family protein n=1 Tax=Actinomadura sp. NBRC 104425 TaxID=3032204 RepID=UPI0024A26DE0|nr:TIGR00730 family Rossman fold protein [Actinomadura sp. NBRC 104425]GLZ09877.1 cytokinin riboside 5'-monophosphate phosphoribohydrolase [Actinomadura sp. NBRC 104425]